MVSRILGMIQVNTLNPFEYTVGPGFINSTCQFPAITSWVLILHPSNLLNKSVYRAGLEDAMVHGQDVQGVYGQLLQFLPLGSETQKYQWRVTNNVSLTSDPRGSTLKVSIGDHNANAW